MTPTETESSMFDAAARMAPFYRSVDWAKTHVGPVEKWPQSLKTALSICLSSRYPLFVWWGPDLTVLYNEAYIPILGKEHPWALGRPGRGPTGVWGEVWDVMYQEEAYFTCSYSPIRDESGGVGGAFTAVPRPGG